MKNNNLSGNLIIQLILLIVLIVFMVLSIFSKSFLGYADLVAGILFFVMAYNKRKIFSKFMLILFIIFGILFIGLGLYNFING